VVSVEATAVTSYPRAPGASGWRLLTAWRGPPATRNTLAAEVTEARARKFHFDLFNPATAAFDVDGRSPTVPGLAELSQDLVALRWDPSSSSAYLPMFRGPIGHTEDKLDATTHVVNVQAADYRAMLDRCLVNAATYTATAQEAIIAALVAPYSVTAAAPYNQGVRVHTVATGVNRTVVYAGTETVAAEINKLATQSGGVEWGCEPAFDTTTPAAPTAELYLWYPTRGTTRPFVAEYGTNVAQVSRVVDSFSFANYVLVTGASGVAAQTAAGDVVANPAAHAEGLWQITESSANETSTTTLANLAAYTLAADSILTPSYQLTLTPGAWRSKNDFWLGDTIEIRVASGRLNVDVAARVIVIDFALSDDSDAETVTVTVARPVLTLAQLIHGQNQNLYALNRR
jgi:hypothetical protein